MEDRIVFDSSTKMWVCSLCSTVEKTVVLTIAPKILEEVSSTVVVHSFFDHVASQQHCDSIERKMGIAEFCPVELNGAKLLLDHHIVYPNSMFGSGSLLFDDTLHCIVAHDICGGVKLIPNHRYTVVQFEIPRHDDALPTTMNIDHRNYFSTPPIPPLENDRASRGALFPSESVRALQSSNHSIVCEHNGRKRYRE